MMDLQKEFPQLQLKVNGERLVYLDSAATALKPRSVIEKIRQHMEMGVANVHRGAHHLSDVATDEFEKTRSMAASLINASSPDEIVFTQGTTNGINLIAYSLARHILQPGDEIIVSQMEHHSNIVPWQMIAKEKGAKVVFTPIRDDGSLDFVAFQKLVGPKTKLVSLIHMSNALGIFNDLVPFAHEIHKQGAYFVVDAAQSISSRPVDVQRLDCDFLVFSGHKLFGPTGVGILYGRSEILSEMPPFFGGGSMISLVDETHSTFLPPPHRFEAGTPAIAEVIGLGEAMKFFGSLDIAALEKQDHQLLKFAQTELEKIDGVQIFSRTVDRSHILSFAVEGAHPSDVGAVLNEQGIAVRAGHHCCQPLMARMGIPGTVRASFSIYSTEQDVARLVSAMKKVKGFFQ
jgi:cysteine desulfurase/selenocysteine lyase